MQKRLGHARFLIATLLVMGAGATSRPAAAASSSIGLGLHAWRTVDDLRSQGFGGIRRDGISYLLSYQYSPGALLKLEADGEYFPNGFGGSTHSAFSPQAYVLLGGFIYGGVGIGTTYSKDFSNNFSSPFYAARAGVNLHLLPRFHLDVNANYRFHAFSELHGVKTGTVTVGALARVGI